MISVVLTRRELVNSRETVYTGGNEINMLDSKPESGCDHESAKRPKIVGESEKEIVVGKKWVERNIKKLAKSEAAVQVR